MRRIKAVLCAVLVVAVWLACAPATLAGIGLQQFESAAIDRNGTPDVQAGSHPYSLITTDALTFTHSGGSVNDLISAGDLKDVLDELPPGFVGDPNAVPKCSYHDLVTSGYRCPNDTTVGVATVYLFGGELDIYPDNVPIYNMEPSPGVAAEFAFLVGHAPVFLNSSVRTGGDYGLTVDVPDVTQAADIYATKVVVWGVPAESSHDPYRGTCLNENAGEIIDPAHVRRGELAGTGLAEGEAEQETREFSDGECPANVPVRPLLTNPTSCGVPRTATFNVDSWQEPGKFVSKSTSMPEITGCEKLDFSPTIAITPDGEEGSTPTGLNVGVHVSQESTINPAGLGEADVRNTTVTLPAGVALSPAASDGLQACSEAQIGLHNAQRPTCPLASKVANVRIKTPLLEEELTGSVYLASPQNFAGPLENPFGSLFALYLVAADPARGVLIKIAGRVSPNEQTGQLAATFENTPELPFEELTIEFYGSDRAPLVTPGRCGTYTTQSSFTPWTGTPAVEPVSSFQITSGPGGSACPGSSLPFSPSLAAGSPNIQAGAFSPFTVTMSRQDGQQSLQSIELHMPEGLSGVLSGVKLCAEAQANAGTCGPESLIGETTVSVGLGNDPYTVTGGKVYLTEKYEGAPYGLSIVNPAKAGPFVLQEGRPIVVRAKIEVNPLTAALTVTSAAGARGIPTIIDGVPLQIKHVNVTIDREGFTFNPTDCDRSAITGTIESAEGASANVSVPFQVTNCAALGFKPTFEASTSGKTSKADGTSLHVAIAYPKNGLGKYANIHEVKVELPKQLPSRLSTLQKACTSKQFAADPAGCPAASVVGHAKALTPILPVALEGPAYFVSYGAAKFPELVLVLQGYGITVDLHGETFISKAGITSSTFKTVPDQPVSSFELTLPAGPYSALTSNGSLCDVTNTVTVTKHVKVRRKGHVKTVTRRVRKKVAGKLLMPTTMIAQNGAEVSQDTVIGVSGCGRAKQSSSGRGRRRRG